MNHKTTLENANKAIIQGDHEAFLNYLTDDIRWNFVGDQILFGKEQIGRYLERFENGKMAELTAFVIKE